MSVWKSVLSRRYLVGILLMMLALVGANGICALLMSGGVIDHHRMWQGSLVVWGLAAMVSASFAVRGKNARLFEKLLVPLVVFLLVLVLSLVLRREGWGNGMWWKCGGCAVLGSLVGGAAAGGKRKKRVGSGMKRKSINRR